jgi:hypothetical protein
LDWRFNAEDSIEIGRTPNAKAEDDYFCAVRSLTNRCADTNFCYGTLAQFSMNFTAVT